MPFSSRKIALLIALFVFLAGPLTAAFIHLKFLPQILILSLLFSSIGLQLTVNEAPWRRYVFAPSIFLILLFAPVVTLIEGFLWIAPPFTADGHPVMALGQVAAGAGLGVLIGLFINYRYFFRLARDSRMDTWMVCAVATSCSIGFLLDRVLNWI